ncbi:hypothetical protein [Synechococcus sp. CS-601]|uniref:hypothetical protein n=1 Tax=Synechococcus sp. CS-601 TaxID=2847983 RepID=UPI00223BD081|nr:hypothetical protein [Synechococcus sp. CS-601]
MAGLATGLATVMAPDSFLSMLLRLASSSDAAEFAARTLSVGTLTGGIPLPKPETASTTTSAIAGWMGGLIPALISWGP